MVGQFGKVLTKIFGSRNERLLKRYQKFVTQINDLEPKVQALTDEAEYGHWELTRMSLYWGGVRRAEIRRRVIRVSRTA